MGKSDSALPPRVEGSDEKAKPAAQHTPGPWSVEDPMGPEILSVIANGDQPVYEWRHIAQLSMEPEDKSDPSIVEQRANARLIAAAPDLYEALKAMFDRWEPDPEPYADRRMWEAARDALNKAEGR